MIAKTCAFLVVVTSVAFAAPCGPCGVVSGCGVVNTVPAITTEVVGTGLLNSGCGCGAGYGLGYGYGAGIVGGCGSVVAPLVSGTTYETVAFPVVAPPACGTSVVSPIVSGPVCRSHTTGVCGGYGYGLGGCGCFTVC